MSVVCPLEVAIVQLVSEDPRYTREAYIFVFEALHYAQDVLRLGKDCPSEPSAGRPEGEETGPQQHVSGQELCEAIRRLALDEYGYMAKLVLGNWGLHATGDIGEIVFNLIRIGQMRKTPQDHREDFDDVFDFERAFCQDFRIVLSEKD